MKSFYLIDEERVKKLERPDISSKVPRKMIELFPIGCACYDVSNSVKSPEDLTLTIANEEFYRTIGYTKEAFEKKKNRLFDVVVGDGQPLKDAIWKAIRNRILRKKLQHWMIKDSIII